MDTHFSIDIETLDTEGDAAVIAVGLSIFTRSEFLHEQLWLINPILSPGSRSKSTWEWWSSQDPEIRNRMLSGWTAPWTFCHLFTALCHQWEVKYAWGYPARFDLGHLRSLYRNMNQEFPINFRQERDLTTLLWAVSGDEQHMQNLKEIKGNNPRPHDALSDAIVQARQIQYLMNVLNIPG